MNTINESEREKAVKHLIDALNSVILAELAVTKSGITYGFNETNDVAVANQVLKWAIQKIKSS